MKAVDAKGLTLIELLIAIAILALIGSAATVILSTTLDAHHQQDHRSRLYQEGLTAMERLTDSVRRCTYLTIPNAHTPVRSVLAVSGFTNDDGDFYFNDPLFPRIDEDLAFDMNADSKPGIAGMDDDGDGLVDEVGSAGDTNDDEVGNFGDEDPVDGQDNDGDGNIDEDCPGDMNNDGAPGIAGMDDDGDGFVDEGSLFDDDEDGSLDEVGLIQIIYYVPGGTTLKEHHHLSGENRTLSDRVTLFRVTYESPERVLIELALTGDDGESVAFAEYACPRNRRQKTGKRVR